MKLRKRIYVFGHCRLFNLESRVQRSSNELSIPRPHLWISKYALNNWLYMVFIILLQVYLVSLQNLQKTYVIRIIVIKTSAKVTMDSIHLKALLVITSLIQYQRVDSKVDIGSFWIPPYKVSRYNTPEVTPKLTDSLRMLYLTTPWCSISITARFHLNFIFILQ